MKNLLLTGSFKYTKNQLFSLKELEINVDFLQFEENIITAYEKYDAVVCNGLFLYHDIKKFRNLKYIQLTSAGYDRVPITYINEHNIMINNARGVYSTPIAEHTIMLILNLFRNASFFTKNQQTKIWEKNRSAIELSDKTVAIAGCGSIGLEIAKKLSGFDVKIIGLDISPIKTEYLTECRSIKELYSVAEAADVFISAMPYSEQSHHIFNSEFFGVMNNDGVFINISRGKLVDENALFDALYNNRIKSAGIDVFEDEPLAFESRLWDLDNLIITPHNSFIGDGNSVRMFDVIYNNLRNWIYEEKQFTE